MAASPEDLHSYLQLSDQRNPLHVSSDSDYRVYPMRVRATGFSCLQHVKPYLGKADDVVMLCPSMCP